MLGIKGERMGNSLHFSDFTGVWALDLHAIQLENHGP